MKKKLMLLLVVSFVLGIAGTALAFPVDFSGDLSLQFRSYDEGIAAHTTMGTVRPTSTIDNELARLRLNFSAQVDNDVTMYGRIASRTWFGNTTTYSNGPVFDQYGVKIANNGWIYNLGRQAVSLGQGAIINTGNDVAIDNKFDGLCATGKLGAVNTQFIVGKTTGVRSQNYSYFGYNCPPANWWGIDFSVPVSDSLTFGATYATSKDVSSSGGVYYPVAVAAKYLGFNATFCPSANLTFNGEYVKANNGHSPWANNAFDSGARDDKAYFIAGTYTWDKDSFTVQYNNVGVTSINPSNSGIGAVSYPLLGRGLAFGAEGQDTYPDSKYSGFTYSYTHQMSKAATFSFCFMDLKDDVSIGNDREYATGIDWKF